MLRFISIRNLAVIDRLEVEFEPGLNVLTGETGAGKSILVGAVGLLVGGRASADLVRTGEEQATVEAVFEDPAGAELMIRRDVSVQSGRSRAFLNGSLVTSAALRELAADLVDLHGQHEHQVLLDPASHLDLLDAFAGLTGDREARARGVHPAAVARLGKKPPRDRRPREDTARGIPPLPADRDRARRTPGWRRRRAGDGTPGPRQCRTAAAVVRGHVHGALRGRGGRAADPLGGLEEARGARLDRSAVRAAPGREGRGQVAARRPRVFPALLRLGHRCVSRRNCRTWRTASRSSNV